MRLIISTLSFILVTLSFSGCSQKEVYTPVTVGTECPKFTKKIDIKIEKLNDEYAKIKWTDVQKLKDLSAAKNKFNEDVQKLNNENAKKMDSVLKN